MLTPITPSQNALIKAEILADPILAAQPDDGDGLNAIADALNVLATPAFIVWKSRVTQDEIMQNGFDWTRVDNLSVGPARVWEWMFSNVNRSIDPSKANVRAGIEAVWKGVAADLAVRAAVYVHCKRSTTRVEKLLATGTGSDAVPALLGNEGKITANEVDSARRS